MAEKREYSTPSATCALYFGRQCEKKCGARLRLRVNPNCSTVRLHNLLANRQSQADTRSWSAEVKTLKGQEDLIPILRVNADTIVSHRETPSITFL